MTNTYAGLGTFTSTIATAGVKKINITLQLPAVQEGSANGQPVVTTVKQNSTTIYTSNAGDRGVSCSCVAAAGDTISVVLTSANILTYANDVKSTVAISGGL